MKVNIIRLFHEASAYKAKFSFFANLCQFFFFFFVFFFFVFFFFVVVFFCTDYHFTFNIWTDRPVQKV